MEFLDLLFELWKWVWGVLGPVAVLLFFLYLKHPEKFEKVVLHVVWVLSAASSWMERRAISKEIAYITGSKFREFFPSIESVPRIEVEWGEEDRVVLDVERGKLVLVLRRGRTMRSDNIARALVMAIPYLIAYEMDSVYDKKVMLLVAAHMARSLVRDNPSVVEAVNQVLHPLVEGDPEALELAKMLVDVDDRSLFTRVLIPEMVEVARERYPQRDPRLTQELVDLVRVLSALARGSEAESPFCRSYFRIVFVLVAKPEKIRKELMPHVDFVKHSLKRCPNARSIYVLAAGRNILAAKYLSYLLMDELKNEHFRVVDAEEQEYRGRYKDAPFMPLYFCRIKLRW